MVKALAINTMGQPASNRENFEKWFGEPLAKLMEDDDCGFVIVMIAFPLLERYLRAITRSAPNKSPFNQALLKVFGELQTEKNASLFWAMYRHSILHNVALSRETHGLSLSKPIVEVCPSGKVWMNPKLFATRVVDTIRNDFYRFEAGIPLAQPQQVIEGIHGTAAFSAYWGAGMPPVAGNNNG